MTDHASFPSVVSFVQEKVGDSGLNLLVNNAGVLLSDNADSKDKASSSGEVSLEVMREAFEVNCIAPLFFTMVFKNLLEQAAAKRFA